MSQIEEVDFDELLALLATEPRNVFVDFWSPWCAPCRTMRPHLSRIADERSEDWRFVAVNAEAQPETASHFDVKALPTLIYFKSGEEAHRFAGAATISAIDEKLDSV